MGSEISFQDIAQLVRDVVHPNDVGDVPYIGLEHIEQGTLRLAGWGRATEVNSAKFRFRKGDVLFGKLRPYFRKVIRAPFDGVCSTDIWVVRARAGFDQGYLFYWMAAQDFVDFASSGSEGTRMPRAKWEHVAQFTRPRLSLPEQRAIARILGALDDKIELNRRMNETLEAMAQALFKSWFVDFDPVVVNALRAGNPIPEKFAARAAHYRDNPDALGLPEDILRLFPARFVDSELDPIPEGWEVGPLSKIANLHTATATPSQEPEAIWEHYSIPAFDEGRMPKLEHGKDIKSGKYRVPATAVLVSKLNPQFPRVWLPDVIDETRAVCSTEFLPFVPRKSQWRPIVYEILRSDAVQEKIRSIATGSTGSRQRVKPKAVAELNIVLASERLLDTFSEWVAPIHNRLLLNQNESRTLAELRDTLLPKLISGELRVPDVEKILEEAV